MCHIKVLLLVVGLQLIISWKHSATLFMLKAGYDLP